MQPLADDFFRLAHHDTTGRPRLQARATGLGLAAALLAELVWEHRVTAQDGLLFVVDRTPPRDALGHAVLDQLVAQSEHREVRTWLEFFGRDADERVAQRLCWAGHVRPETRGFVRSSTVWMPTDINVAYLPWWRLSTLLKEGGPAEHGDRFLVGLAAATGLDNALLQDAPPSGRRYLDHLVATVWPPLQDLLVHTQAAVGDAVLHYRK